MDPLISTQARQALSNTPRDVPLALVASHTHRSIRLYILLRTKIPETQIKFISRAALVTDPLFHFIFSEQVLDAAAVPRQGHVQRSSEAATELLIRHRGEPQRYHLCEAAHRALLSRFWRGSARVNLYLRRFISSCLSGGHCPGCPESALKGCNAHDFDEYHVVGRLYSIDPIAIVTFPVSSAEWALYSILPYIGVSSKRVYTNLQCPIKAWLPHLEATLFYAAAGVPTSLVIQTPRDLDFLHRIEPLASAYNRPLVSLVPVQCHSDPSLSGKMNYALSKHLLPSGQIALPPPPMSSIHHYAMSPSTQQPSPSLSDSSHFSSDVSSMSGSPSPYNTPFCVIQELPLAEYPANESSEVPQGTPRNRRRPDSHIRRPRNAFIIFRCEMCKANKISSKVEKDHRRISQIIASCWNSLTFEQRKPWYDKAAQEKEAHRCKYPNYRFTPATRSGPVQRRKTRGNGPQDKERDKRVGAALAAGIEGPKLEAIVKQIDASLSMNASPSTHHTASLQPTDHSAVFRSPLLAPNDMPSRHNSKVHGSARSSKRSAQSAMHDTGYATEQPCINIGCQTYQTNLVPVELELDPGMDVGVPYTDGFYYTTAWDQTAMIPPMAQTSNSALGLNLQSETRVHNTPVDYITINSAVGQVNVGSSNAESPSKRSSEHRRSSEVNMVFNYPPRSTHVISGGSGGIMNINCSSNTTFYNPSAQTASSRQPTSRQSKANEHSGDRWASPAHAGPSRAVQEPLTEEEIARRYQKTVQRLERQERHE
ncbi:hypothetical protein NM688_g4791 [Phlebia brevispora]|uniref:Uncharacterized protein n=1 Tax=Phlebia brevispora TaxID=194682 RepID=A0ACC1T2I6_9APHY|nr:hypothetical protein NM688_g4791 [Phlebia brevispora]